MTNWIFNNRLGSFAADSVGMLIKNLPVGLHMDQIHSVEEALAEVKKQVTDGITHCSYDYFAKNDSPFINDPMEVNYQLNINADELTELYPFRLELPRCTTPCLAHSALRRTGGIWGRSISLPR